MVVKGTMVRGPRSGFVAAPAPAVVRPADVPHFPDAPESSIRYPSDLCSAKPGADVIVIADAISPRPVQALDVAVRIGTHPAPLRIHGERIYYRSLTGISVGPAAPFERKPIVYERAYGGATPDKRIVDLRNPVGRGVAARAADLVDQPAPQIEHPAQPITSASDRPEPAGYGAIPMSWQSRAQYAGTTDERWRRTRMPLMPLDFDPRFNHVAHPSLRFPAPIAPGTLVALQRLTEDGAWQFEVPSFPVRIEARFDDGRTEVAMPGIDTLLIEATAGRVELTARHAFRRGRGRTLLRELRVQTAS